MSRMTTATVNGTTYSIPDVWLMGYCTANRCSVAEAVAWWAYQAELENVGA